MPRKKHEPSMEHRHPSHYEFNQTETWNGSGHREAQVQEVTNPTTRHLSTELTELLWSLLILQVNFFTSLSLKVLNSNCFRLFAIDFNISQCYSRLDKKNSWKVCYINFAVASMTSWNQNGWAGPQWDNYDFMYQFSSGNRALIWLISLNRIECPLSGECHSTQ